jgi:uncharacterized protein with NRDE domain
VHRRILRRTAAKVAASLLAAIDRRVQPMCLIAFAWQVNAAYPLVLAANRDEVRTRAAAPAAFWDDRPGLLAGRDLSAGGTWLGVTRAGELAAITNARGRKPFDPRAPSRGRLVVGILDASFPPDVRRRGVEEVGARLNGFNLLHFARESAWVLESARSSGRAVERGVHALSNHMLDTPWPKVERAKRRLAAAMASQPDDTALLDLLRDDTLAPDADLPSTGLSLERERRLSPVFIRGEEYGTRCSTIVRMAADGRVDVVEWTWNAAGEVASRVEHHFQRSAM